MDYNWSRYSRIIDIGGALGSMLGTVLHRNPGCTGVLFDQHQVIVDARKVWKETESLAALQDRVTLVGGDFFDSATIPKARDGDFYFLRVIIHDWSDEESIDILRAIRKAIGSAKVTLALMEVSMLPSEFSRHPAIQLSSTLDALMLNLVRGKERSQQQYEDLFDASGFKLVKCHPTRSPMWITEAIPV